MMTVPRTLELWFEKSGHAGGSANYVRLRYQVIHEGRAKWALRVEAGDSLRTLMFRSKREAQSWARRDFRRRQLLRSVAA